MGGVQNRRLKISIIVGMWLLFVVFIYFAVTYAAKKVARLEKAKDINGLIAALDGEWQTASLSAEALGRLGDLRAVEPLIALLAAKERDHNVRKSAAIGLGDLKDLRAITPLVFAENDEDSEVQASAAAAIVKFGPAAIDRLLPHLTNWAVNRGAAEALKKLGWQSQTDEQRIHLLVASRDGAGVAANWDAARMVLLQDVQSCQERMMNWSMASQDPATPPAARAQTEKDLMDCRDDPERVRNALNALVSTGKAELIPILIKELDSVSDRKVAEAYLNCGQTDLAKAASDWATKHGYEIKTTSGSGSAAWGRW
jgi:hypothetical protein